MRMVAVERLANISPSPSKATAVLGRYDCRSEGFWRLLCANGGHSQQVRDQRTGRCGVAACSKSPPKGRRNYSQIGGATWKLVVHPLSMTRPRSNADATAVGQVDAARRMCLD